MVNINAVRGDSVRYKRLIPSYIISLGTSYGLFEYITDSERLKTLTSFFYSSESSSFQYSGVATLIALAAVIVPMFVRLIRRNITTTENRADFFSAITANGGEYDDNLVAIPHNRFGYSDRLAYVCAELSELAYHPVYQSDGLKNAIRNVLTTHTNASKNDVNTSIINVESLLRPISGGGEYAISEQDLLNKISTAGFDYNVAQSNPDEGDYLAFQTLSTKQQQRVKKNKNIKDIYLDSIQGFACAYTKQGPENAYIVISFRGSEANVEDWLTNIDAEPYELNENEGRVHKGFYFSQKVIEEKLRSVIERLSSLNKNGKRLADENCPIIFTGHSLGGAIATIAAREYERFLSEHNLPQRKIAVYTFGAPRVADYEYFHQMKAPVYRIVNSADAVPRLPLGFYNQILLLFFKGIKRVIAFFSVPAAREGGIRGNGWLQMLYNAFLWVESSLDEQNRYRHTGDLRYLTDIARGHIEEVELLPNPCRFDRLHWFFRSIRIQHGAPITSHSMQIYRNKLEVIVTRRNASFKRP